MRPLANPGRLAAHLQQEYGIVPPQLTPLDAGVFHVARDDGPDWVARCFLPPRTRDAVAQDATFLAWLAGHHYPAERLAAPRPLSMLDDTSVLITDYIVPVPPEGRRDAIRAHGGFRHLGKLLAQLHSLPPPPHLAPGGAWHHFADGPPDQEVAAARASLARLGPAAALLLARLDDADCGAGLPSAPLHPDFVFANAVVSPTRGLVMTDWTGAGLGPRLWSLAWALYTAAVRSPDLKRMSLLLSGYLGSVTLSPEEWRRLPAVMRVRPIVLEAWKLTHGLVAAPEALRNIQDSETLCHAVVSHLPPARRLHP